MHGIKEAQLLFARVIVGSEVKIKCNMNGT